MKLAEFRARYAPPVITTQGRLGLSVSGAEAEAETETEAPIARDDRGLGPKGSLPEVVAAIAARRRAAAVSGTATPAAPGPVLGSGPRIMSKHYEISPDGTDALLKFGQYSGTRVSTVADNRPGYLDWMLRSGGFPADLLAVVRGQLERVGVRVVGGAR